MKEIMIKAVVENLCTVQDFVIGMLTDKKCSEKTRMQIMLAVEEVFVNIAHYAYHPKTGQVTVRAEAGDEIVIEFEDSGMPYNPLEKPDPDIAMPNEEREEGGLGVYIVKQIMDKMSYCYKDGKNILTVSKRIS